MKLAFHVSFQHNSRQLTRVISEAVQGGQHVAWLRFQGTSCRGHVTHSECHEHLVPWVAPQAHETHDKLHDLCLAEAPASQAGVFKILSPFYSCCTASECLHTPWQCNVASHAQHCNDR